MVRKRGRLAALWRWLARLVVMAAWAYPVALACLWALFSGVGESWWVTATALYVPRVLFGVPLLLLVPGLLWSRRKNLLWTQAVAALILLFPVMGFTLSLPVSKGPGASLRLMTFNVNSGYSGIEALLRGVDHAKPDIVIFQEAPTWSEPLLQGLRARFAHVEVSTQFFVASRFPILETTEPDAIPHGGRERSPRFIRYVLDSSLGPLVLYNVHPISPRGVFGGSSFRGVLHNLRTGEALAGSPEADVEGVTQLRVKQVQLIASMAASEKNPVVIAGDTNLPGLSALLRRSFSGYSDAFATSSSGFGYSYPQRWPFLRLDRVMLSEALRATSFELGCQGASDHLCVVSTFERR